MKSNNNENIQSKKKSNSFIIQGSILAFAGILVRVIGLIYRIPLNRILGNVGNDYYGTAYDIYNILLLLSSTSMPLAVSKIVSEKIQAKEYVNVKRVFTGALIYALILGGIFGGLTFFGADWIASVIYRTPPAGRALKILAPTITIVCVLGVFRGYFQGMGDMIPTAVSQIFEQIVNAVVSVVAAYELGVYGLSVAEMTTGLKPKDIINMKLSWSAAGGTLGTCSGAAIALLVMFIIFMKRRSQINKLAAEDSTGKCESYGKINKTLILTITPVLISTTIYNISNQLDNPIYKNISAKITHMADFGAFWGMYSQKYRVLTTMPIAIAAALSTAIVPSLVRSYVAGDKEQITEKISLALKFAMIIAFPCGVGLSVIGGPINGLLYDDFSKDIAFMMVFSVFTVVSFSLSTISNAILQGIDKLNVPIKNSAISLGIHIVVLPVLMLVFKLGITAVVIGDFLFAITVCFLNAFSIKKFLGYRQNLVETFVKPMIASAIMGVITFAVYNAVMAVCPHVLVSVPVAIVIAAGSYGLLLILTKTITEEELEAMPKGSTIITLCRKLRLFK
ncbi:MAG: polysaccharide biosynthesis protein [Lachnospiraceae bacterium]|nr:polysaccharide biosynthesis protein [Lachnospiraceae bacterium]